MSEDRKPIRDDQLPPDTDRCLIIHWNAALNEVWIDSSGFSVFDTAGVLEVAFALAEAELPVPCSTYSEEIEDQ